MERSRSRSPQRSKNKRTNKKSPSSRSPPRSATRSASTRRNISPKVSMDLLRQSMDPLKKVMVPYLDIKSLKNFNIASHIFNEISNEQLEIEKYKNRLRKFAKNFDLFNYRIPSPTKFVNGKLRHMFGKMTLLLSQLTNGFDFSKYVDPKILEIIENPVKKVMKLYSKEDLQKILDFYNMEDFNELDDISYFVDPQLPKNIVDIAKPIYDDYLLAFSKIDKSDQRIINQMSLDDMKHLLQIIKQNMDA
jgi:hypothetical protein